ncbi:MAG: 2Fe-2S iron-sulfur cluster-binding protein, partial [Gemmatimonadales bacterium]
KPVVRTYSLSNRPGMAHYRLTIKREAAPPGRPDTYPGVSSNYFHDHIDVGSRLLAKAPRGKFYLDPMGNTPIALVSAGVGLTPLVSMLEAIVATGADRPTWFVHGARDGRLHAMGALVRRIANEHDNVHAHVRYSRPTAEDALGRDFDDEGHVDVELLKRLLPNTDCDFYLCGPTAFLQSLFKGLLAWGIAEHRINYEFFGPASALKERARVATPTRIAEIAECCNEVEVTFSKSGVRAHWNPSFDSILDLAEANGLSPDYSCRSGICQTCICEIEEGDVEYVLEPLDSPDEGSVLICCSKPTTAVVITL